MFILVLTLVLITIIIYTLCGVSIYYHTRAVTPMVDVELYPVRILPEANPFEKCDLFAVGSLSEDEYDDDDVASVSSLLPGLRSPRVGGWSEEVEYTFSSDSSAN
ncbi:MAG: hypothetical protein Q9221_008482 [Calogaya cf. arnoldii]